MSIYSTPIAPIRTPRWRRPWARWLPRYSAGRPRLYLLVLGAAHPEAAPPSCATFGTPALHPRSRPTRRSTAGIEESLLDVLGEEGIGCIAPPPLAQGLPTVGYLDGAPGESRASRDDSLSCHEITERNLTDVRALNQIAAARGQSLARALGAALGLRDERATSAPTGASSVAQLEANLAAAGQSQFSAEGGWAVIDGHAVEAGINIRPESSRH